MNCVFIQLRCRPGRTYEVADAIYDREFASELYSTSGEYDLLDEGLHPRGRGRRPLRQREDPRHPAHRPQPDHADLQGVLMIADWDDAYANAAHIPDGDGYPPRWEARRRRLPRRLRPTGCARIPYGAHPRQRLDLFLPEAAPHGLVVFVHGGYWRALRPQHLVAPRRRTARPRLGGGDARLSCWRPRPASPRSPR